MPHSTHAQLEVIAGSMFCHRAGQLLLLANGSLREVELLRKGDLLMGPDGAPREVLATHEGVGPMAEVRPARGGNPFVVTLDHQLTLMDTPRDRHGKPAERGGRIVDVSVREWLRWSNSKKGIFKLWRVGVGDFHGGGLAHDDLDPYFLGLLLGDGSITQGVGLSKPDLEVRQEAVRQAEKYGLTVQPDGEGSSVTWRIVGTRGVANPIAEKLRDLGLYGRNSARKFIPDRYKTASRRDRRELLGGLMDSDGSSDGFGFDYVSASRQLAEDVAFVARSLGLCARVKPCTKSCQTGASGTYYRTRLSGDTHVVATRIPRKQILDREVKKRSDLTRFDVSPLPQPEPYFGVTVNGDNRYLLDDFTVTHNCGKTEELIRRLRRAQIGRQKVQVFKPAIDNRYGEGRIASHAGQHLTAVSVPTAADLVGAVAADTQVVGIDEGQFFGPAILPWIELQVREGRRVIVALLDLDYLGQPFGIAPDLLAMADDVVKLAAVCVECGGHARRSYRIADGHGQTLVGGAESYEALCRVCYNRRSPI